jgi:hypothetical protein
MVVYFLHWSVKYEREIEKTRREGGRERETFVVLAVSLSMLLL